MCYFDKWQYFISPPSFHQISFAYCELKFMTDIRETRETRETRDIKQGFSLASWTLNERRLNEWMATFHYYKHEFKGSWNTTFKHKASKYGMFRRPTYQTPIISLGNLIHFEWNRRVCEKALLVKFYAKLSLLCAKRDQPRFERSENRVWSVAPSLLQFLPNEHPSYTVSYARVSVRTWFVPTLHKPFFTWLLLPFLMQECQWGPDLSLHYRSPSSHGFYCRFLCKTVSEDLICPYTKEALLHMVFIAVSYARLQVRTWASLPPESSQVVAKGDGLRVKNVVWVVYLESKRYSRYLKNKYIIRKDPKNLTYLSSLYLIMSFTGFLIYKYT